MRLTIKRYKKKATVQNATNNYKYCYVHLVKKEVKSFLFEKSFILEKIRPFTNMCIYISESLDKKIKDLKC